MVDDGIKRRRGRFIKPNFWYFFFYIYIWGVGAGGGVPLGQGTPAVLLAFAVIATAYLRMALGF